MYLTYLTVLTSSDSERNSPLSHSRLGIALHPQPSAPVMEVEYLPKFKWSGVE